MISHPLKIRKYFNSLLITFKSFISFHFNSLQVYSFVMAMSKLNEYFEQSVVRNYTLLLATKSFHELEEKYNLDCIVKGYIKNDGMSPYPFWAIVQKTIPEKGKEIYFVDPVKDSMHRKRTAFNFTDRCWMFHESYRPTSLCKLCDNL